LADTIRIAAAQARKTLGALLDRAEHGDEVVITRNGRPVARLVSVNGFDREKARQAAENIIARSKGVTLGGFKIKDLVNGGRS
jgi:prevent-host-death family protein